MHRVFADITTPQAAGPSSSASSQTEPSCQDMATASMAAEDHAAPFTTSSKLQAAEDEVKAAMLARNVPSLQAAVRNLVGLMASSSCSGQQIAQVSLMQQLNCQ